MAGYLLFAGLLGISSACGTNSFFDCERPVAGFRCQEPSDEERGKKALRDQDYALAITFLERAVDGLLAQDHLSADERYRLHPLLASAYAAKAGVDLMSLAQVQTGGQQSLFAALSSVLPHPQKTGESAYLQSLADIKSALAQLEGIPSQLLVDKASELFGKSVALQKTLYLTASSVMAINRFAISSTTGSLDRVQLENMSDKDAAEILAGLEAASREAHGDQPEIEEKIKETLTQINGEPGANQKEKLAAYIAKNAT